GARLPNISSQQKQIHQLLDGSHRVFVLREPHGPTDDNPVGPDINFSGFNDLLLCEPAFVYQEIPVEVADEFPVLFKVYRVLEYKSLVENIAFRLFLLQDVFDYPLN